MGLPKGETVSTVNIAGREKMSFCGVIHQYEYPIYYYIYPFLQYFVSKTFEQNVYTEVKKFVS